MSREYVTVLAGLLCACGTDLPTSVPEVHQAAADVELYKENHWEVWSNSFSGCGHYVSGSFDVHLNSQSVVVNGAVRFRGMLNVPRGRLYDADGNEYRFQELSHVQVNSPDGYDQVNEFRYRFQIISPGKDLNQVIESTLTIIWDAGNLTITSVYMSDCRG